jgi:hypothetical protein
LPLVSWKTWTAAAVLAITVLVLIVVPATHGVHPNGSLGLGDGIVGAGTLLLALGTAFLAIATFRVDRSVASREEERRTAQLRGIARLMTTELAIVQDVVRETIKHESYNKLRPMPYTAWDRYAVDLLSFVSIEDGRVLVRCFADLQILDTQMTRHFAEFPDQRALTILESSESLFHALSRSLPPALEIVRRYTG